MEVPVNWPEEAVAFQAELSFRRTATDKRSMAQGVAIRLITDERHPAQGEMGLFASQSWDTFDIMGEYIGVVGRSATAHGSDYVAELHGDWVVDAQAAGNEFRFVNDYRNVATCQNVTFRATFVNRKPHLLVVVTQPICEGDEILGNYGDDYWAARRSNAAHAEATVAISPLGEEAHSSTSQEGWAWAAEMENLDGAAIGEDGSSASATFAPCGELA